MGKQDSKRRHGATVEELEKAMAESVDFSLAWCAERGKTPEKPCSGKFMVRTSPELHSRASNVTGPGSDLVIDAVKARYPGAVVAPSADENTIRWDTSPLAAEIRTGKTPGKLLRAYRERAALTVVELARLVGTKYPNIVAMERDRRTIGLDMARKLADVFRCEYTKFLDAPDNRTTC